MMTALVKKVVIFGVIGILFAMSIMPTLAQRSIVNQDKKIIKTQIEEYCVDGTIITRDVKLTQQQTNELKNQLINTPEADKRLTILQSYGLIPDDITMNDLKQDMFLRAEALGITPQKVQELSLLLDPVIKQRPPILLDFFSKVSTTHLSGGSMRIGLSSLIGYLNFLRGWNLPKADFFDAAWGLIGVVDSRGLFNEHSLVTFPGFMCLTGFVGYNVKLPLFAHNFVGYSAITFAAGIGVHTVIWFYWLNQLPN